MVDKVTAQHMSYALLDAYAWQRTHDYDRCITRNGYSASMAAANDKVAASLENAALTHGYWLH